MAKKWVAKYINGNIVEMEKNDEEENPYQYTPKTPSQEEPKKKGFMESMGEKYKDWRAKEPERKLIKTKRETERYETKLKRLERQQKIEKLQGSIYSMKEKRMKSIRPPSDAPRMGSLWSPGEVRYPSGKKRKKPITYGREPSLFSGRGGLPPGF